MNKEKEHIDTLFQEGLKNYSVTPPEHIWDSIEKELDKKKKNRAIIFLWKGSAAAAVVGLLMTAFFLFSKHDKSIKLADQTTINQSVNKEIVEKKGADRKTDLSQTQNIDYNNNKSAHSENAGILNNAVNSISSVHPDNTFTNAKNTIITNSISRSFVIAPDSLMPLDGKSNAVIPVNNQVDVQFAFVQNNAEKILLRDPNMDLLDEIFKDETKEKKNNQNKISIGGLIAPTYAYRNTSQSSTANTEEGITNISGGLNFRMKTSKKLEIETGITFAQVGQNFSNTSSSKVYSSLVYGDEIKIVVNNENENYSNSLGSLESSSDASSISTNSVAGSLKVASVSSSTTNVQQRLNYIEVPLIAKYKLIDKKFDVAFLSGISSNFLIGNSAYLVNDGDKTDLGGISGINSVSFSATLGLGFQTPITRSINLNIEPRFKYFINSVSSSNSYRPYSIGIFTGVSYKF